MLRWASLIDEHLEELAQLESADVGHPITDARNVDVPNARNCIAWYAEAIDKVYGEIAPTGADALALVGREPLGVVGAVIPVELPVDHHGVEARACFGYGQLGGVEARGAVAADRAGAGRVGG